MLSVGKLCKEAGCKLRVWSNGLCKNHIPKTPLSAKKTSGLRVSSFKRDVGEILRMQELFLDIWKTRPHKSEVSGESLGKEPLSIFFHHILPKEKYPQARLDEHNIILLTLDEHTNVENDIYKYPEINLRREILKAKYNIR